MRKYLFIRAKNLKDKVKKVSESENQAFFELNLTEVSHIIRIYYKKNKLNFSCTCPHYSIQGRICSHILACLNYMIENAN